MSPAYVKGKEDNTVPTQWKLPAKKKKPEMDEIWKRVEEERKGGWGV